MTQDFQSMDDQVLFLAYILSAGLYLSIFCRYIHAYNYKHSSTERK